MHSPCVHARVVHGHLHRPWGGGPGRFHPSPRCCTRPKAWHPFLPCGWVIWAVICAPCATLDWWWCVMCVPLLTTMLSSCSSEPRSDSSVREGVASKNIDLYILPGIGVVDATDIESCGDAARGMQSACVHIGRCAGMRSRCFQRALHCSAQDRDFDSGDAASHLALPAQRQSHRLRRCVHPVLHNRALLCTRK
jgi:hypothetical protein